MPFVAWVMLGRDEALYLRVAVRVRGPLVPLIGVYLALWRAVGWLVWVGWLVGGWVAVCGLWVVLWVFWLVVVCGVLRLW